MTDFFISYTRADRDWAVWIAWVLEEKGYTTIIQDWDFRPGGNFVLDMQKAAAGAERTVAILSPDYLESRFGAAEWAAAFAKDPTGEKGILLPVRVREVGLEGLLPQVVYIDLVGLDQNTSRVRLLAGVKRERAKPARPPAFPGPPPPFPGSPHENPTPALPIDRIPDPGPLPNGPRMPFAHNPLFVGRQEDLRILARQFKAGETSAVGPVEIAAATGLGGIGKTSLDEGVVRMIYERQMYAILASTAPTIIMAGRGMGKTSVLKGLAEKTEGEVLYVAGREFEPAFSAIKDALEKVKARKLTAVLVDDLDYMLDEERNDMAIEALQKVETLLSEMKRTHGQLIVASTSPVSRFLRTFARQLWSDIEDRFQRVVLFPWSMGWRETLRFGTISSFPGRGEEYAPAVEEITGGHPALVSAAFVSLQEAEAAGRIQTGIDWSAYLSSILGRGSLSPIEKALNRLQRSTYSTDQEALDYLKALVSRQDDPERLPSPQAVRALELSGLAYSDPLTGHGVVPGTIIQRYLEGELVATPRAQPEVTVTVASRGNDEGLLVVGDPPVLEIPLSKGPWRLVQTLFNARGGTVALEDLQKRLELDSPKPLYSIIQRLDQKAKEARLERFIENVRGQGYRLNRALRWKT